MTAVKVLVLGNGAQINDIRFDLIKNDVITLGINRIWLKHLPNYLFFHDFQIISELKNHPEILANLIQKSTIFSSDWLKKGKSVPKWISVYNREATNMRVFPDSATTAIRLFFKKIMPNKKITFYVAATPLTWSEPSHFWKELGYSSSDNNNYVKGWYDKRFSLMLDNFKSLKNVGYDIVSVTPNSALNKIFRYENIGNLYKKELKRDSDSF